jgi:hypothetical protein
VSRRAQENVLAIVLVGILVAVIIVSMNYGPRSRLVPVPVAVFSLILVIAQMVVQNTGSPDDLHVDVLEMLTRRTAREGLTDKAKSARPRPVTAHPPGTRARREIVAFVVLAILLGLVLLLGPITGIFLFVLGYAAVVGRLRWYSALALSFGVSGALYLLFVVLLNTQMYYGILPGPF